PPRRALAFPTRRSSDLVGRYGTHLVSGVGGKEPETLTQDPVQGRIVQHLGGQPGHAGGRQPGPDPREGNPTHRTQTFQPQQVARDRKSTRLNSSHVSSS